MAEKKNLVQRHIEMLRQFEESKKVEAGWFESARYTAGLRGNGKPIPSKLVGTPYARIARILEFGATIKRGDKVITIPARPFMRFAWHLFKQRQKKTQHAIADQLFHGKIDAEQALGQIGLALEGCIVESIDDKGQWAANAPATIEDKGFDRPLIDSSQMWQGVASKVSDNSSNS